MPRTLDESIRTTSNDYGSLEAAYREASQAQLVTDPFSSPAHQVGPITNKLSVIITAWNIQPTLRLGLTAIEQSTLNLKHPHLLQVVVVDDGSTDGTWDILKHLEDDLHLV